MGVIKRLGGFVGSHMPFILPICVATGILFADQIAPAKAIVPMLFAVITFQGSLNTSIHQVIETFRRPFKLVVILACTTVVMPILAYALASMCFSDQEIVTGIVVEYSIPIAVVSFMWIDMFHGNASLGLAAILISTVCAPFTIPLIIQLLMGAAVAVDPMSMMSDLLFMVAIPAIVGVTLNELTHGWGHETLSPNLGPICRLFTLVVVTCNSTGLAPYFISFDIVVLQSAAFILCFSCFGFVLGMIVARVLHASMPDLFTIVFCIGLRNISSGAVIAAEFFPGSAIIPVMMGTLFQQVLAAIVGSILQRIVGDERRRTLVQVRAARKRQRGEKVELQ